MSINSVILTGRLTRDVELKTTQSNISVCSFTLAVDKGFKDDGADFINCVVWRIQAENLVKYKHKGDLIGIQGRLSTRQYDTENGTKYVTEVVCDTIEFLDSKKQEKQEEVKSGKFTSEQVYEAAKQLAAQEDPELPF